MKRETRVLKSDGLIAEQDDGGNSPLLFFFFFSRTRGQFKVSLLQGKCPPIELCLLANENSAASYCSPEAQVKLLEDEALSGAILFPAALPPPGWGGWSSPALF